jgi:hypothetical protein
MRRQADKTTGDQLHPEALSLLKRTGQLNTQH